MKNDPKLPVLKQVHQPFITLVTLSYSTNTSLDALLSQSGKIKITYVAPPLTSKCLKATAVGAP